MESVWYLAASLHTISGNSGLATEIIYYKRKKRKIATIKCLCYSYSWFMLCWIKGTLDDIKDMILTLIFLSKFFYLILEMSIYYKGLLHESLSDIHHLLGCPLQAYRILECFSQGSGVTDIPATRGYDVSIIHTWPALTHRGCRNTCFSGGSKLRQSSSGKPEGIKGSLG